MEKKKLLLVAVSVGVFLVIVISAAILVFFKSGTTPVSPVVSSLTSPAVPEQSVRSATTDTAEWVKNDEYRGLQSPASISPIQENTINIYGESSVTVDSKGENVRTITVPKPSTAAVPDPAPAVSAKPAVQPAKPAQADPGRADTGRADTGRADTGRVSSTSASAPAKAAAPAAPKKSYRDFWVQAGSFSTRERADGVKSTLDNKGLQAIITNQEVNGNTYYRVRVGPYTSQNEADYWLAMIKSIDGFQNSQIWESQTYR